MATNNSQTEQASSEKTSIRDGGDHKTYTVVDELDQDDLVPEHDETLSTKTLIELSICILTFIARGLCLNSIGPTLIDLRQITNSTIEASAYIFVSQSSGFFCGSIAAKFLLETCNKELLMSLILVAQAFSTIMIPAFSTLWLMCIAFIGQGFCLGVAGIGVCTMCLVLGGKKRSGQFLQAAYLGVSIGSIVGPFVAKPFLSVEAQNMDGIDGLTGLILNNATGVLKISTLSPSIEPLLNSSLELSTMFTNTSVNSTTAFDAVTTSTVSPTTPFVPLITYTKSHVFYVYMIMAIIMCVPATGFMVLFFINRKNNHGYQPEKNVERLTLRNINASLLLAIMCLFSLSFLYFGLQDSYSNLLTTFCVRSKLGLEKVKGVYITSLFWASVCFGRLNGIWIAKFLTPFKMLLCDLVLASIFATLLAIWGDKSETILWLCSGMLGVSFASVNGATVAWAAKHIAGNGYILGVIMVGRCLGLMAIPSGLAGLFRTAGAMSLMYTVFIISVSLLVLILVLQAMTKMCGQEGRIVGRNYTELDEELEEMNQNTKSE